MLDLVQASDIVIYMDDILIASVRTDSHLKTLWEVFTVLVENKFELHLKKYSFLCTNILDMQSPKRG